MLAACTVVDAKPAAASAALPETKVRLFKISSLARTPSEGGESGATAHRIDTGNVADLPVRACYGKPQLYLMNDEETRETPAFPPHRARHRRRPAGGQSVAAHRRGRRAVEAEPGHPHHRAGRSRRHDRHRRPPAGGFPPAGLGP